MGAQGHVHLISLVNGAVDVFQDFVEEQDERLVLGQKIADFFFAGRDTGLIVLAELLIPLTATKLIGQFAPKRVARQAIAGPSLYGVPMGSGNDNHVGPYQSQSGGQQFLDFFAVFEVVIQRHQRMGFAAAKGRFDLHH